MRRVPTSLRLPLAAASSGAFLMTLLAVLLTGRLAAAAPALPPSNEPLYFALELKHEGKVLATPKLLGTPGKWIHAERRLPGASTPDYKLSLLPTSEGRGFRIDLDLLVPRAQATGKADAITLEHGEERRVKLGTKAKGLEVTMLVMRVHSPEFRALMGLENGNEAKQPETI